MNIFYKIFLLILIYEFNFICCLHVASTTSGVRTTTSKRSVGICKANQTTLTPVTTWEIIHESELQNYPCNDGTNNICSKLVMVPKNISHTVSVKGFKQVNVCCKGYKKMGKVCEPRCYPECEHGKCIKPDTCRCDRGYKPLTNSKCTPNCQNCKNGYCLTPTECKCYSLFEKGDNGTCVRRCEPKCENGDCLESGDCSCHPGYEPDTQYNNTCNPICRTSCGDGGQCIAPDVCECNSYGYRLNSTKQCEPICDDCDYGVCIKPGECVCNKNYESVKKVVGQVVQMSCNPICHIPCGDGGSCIAPDICECSFGYRLNGTQQCEPVCGNCDNGVCVRPGECVCHENYESKSKYIGHKIERRCEPICHKSCGDGGHCIQPDVCECSSDYRLNATSQCEPICDRCDNGVCIKPGECECNKNYQSTTNMVGDKIETRCEPVCRVPCGDGGQCIAPDICKCSSGYRLSATQQCEPVCKRCDNGVCIKPGECVCNENYERKRFGNKNETKCEPICRVPCGDGGYCIAPDVCKCKAKYQLNSNQQCEPICDSCDNGVCIKPDECECNENYKLQMFGNNNETRCEPICHLPCVNSVCSDVNECTCNEGYERDHNLKHVCIPLCDPPCINGRCPINNECDCLPGYLSHSFKDRACVNCTYTCNENDVCSMPEGCPCPDSEEFNTNTNSCEKPPVTVIPECTGECTNSNCTYGHCICYEGYSKIENDSNSCIPLCNNQIDGCVNGRCIAPDVCQCFDGYALNLNSIFECSLVEISTTTVKISTTAIPLPITTITTIVSPSSPSSPSSTTEFIERSDNILDQPLNQVPDTECHEGDCHSEMEQMVNEDKLPRLIKAHLNYILIVIGVTILAVIIVLSMIYRKYNRTKTFKTHEQEAFLSSPYFIGGPIKTSCDIELEES